MDSQYTDSPHITKIRHLFDDILDFVYPPLCLGCGEFVDNGSIICDKCGSALETFEEAICLNCRRSIASGSSCPGCKDEGCLLFAYGHYEGPLRETILQFKFKGVTSPAKHFASAVVAQFGNSILKTGAGRLMPIPLHPSRENRRGYNQAALFARELSRRLNIPTDENTLFRHRKKRPQAKLTEAQRMKNIRGVFGVDEESNCSTRVILVDDVVTSGSTVLEAKQELNRAGYEVPAVISMAHKL